MFLTMLQVICILLGTAFVLGMHQELNLAESRLGADVIVYPTQAMSKISKSGLLMQGTPVQVWKSRAMLTRLADCDNISAVSYQIYILDESEKDHVIRITAYDPASDFVISPWIAEGQSFIPPDDTVVVGSNVTLSDGESLVLFQRNWPVKGHLLPTGSNLDDLVFVNINTLHSLIKAASDVGIHSYENIDPDRFWSAALIRVDDKQNVESVTNWINIYVRKVTAIRSEESLAAAASDIQHQIKQISILAVVIWIILLSAMWITQSILMKERTKELYVWRSVGASQTKIESVFLMEAFWIHLSGASAGIFISGVLLLAIKNFFINNIISPLSVMLPAAVISVFLSISVGCIGVWASVQSTFRSLKGHMLVSF